MSRAIIAPGESYHIYNKALDGQLMCLDKADYARMLFYIIFFQSPLPIYNVSDYVKSFLQTGSFNVSADKLQAILANRSVELQAFTLMPTHPHLQIYEREEGGISRYVQRFEIAHTKYINTKYKRSGYLFRGPFQSVHIESNEQILHLSAYLHRNQRELKGWRGKEHFYPWSSFQDYMGDNRWGELLKPDIVLGQFNNPEEYKQFVDTSGVKDFDEELFIDYDELV